MADYDVEAQFGAKIDDLISGVEQVKNSINSINTSVAQGTSASAAHADAVTGHMSKISSSILSIGNPLQTIQTATEALMAAFAIEKVVDFVKEMSNLGVQAQRTAMMLGTTLEFVDVLSGVAKVSGTSMDTLALSMERLSLGVQRSTRDALSPQAQALKALGINARDFIALDTEGKWNSLTSAVSRFNPSLNLTNTLMTIGGRGMAQMLPSLMLGTEGFKQLEAQVKSASEGFAEAAPGMADTHTKLALLSISTESMSAVLFTQLKPSIDAIIKQMQGFIDETKESIKEGGTWSYVLSGIAYAAKGVATAIASVSAMIRFLSVEAKAFWETTEESSVEVGQRLRADLDKLTADFKKTMADLWSVTPQITVRPSGGADIGALKENARQEIEILQTRLEGEIGALKAQLSLKKTIYDADAAQWKTTDDKKFALTMAAADAEFTAEREKLLKIQALWPQHTKEWEAVQNKIGQITGQHANEMVKLNAASIASMQAKWTEMLNGIQQSFNSQLKGLLQGTTTWSQAWRAMLLDMVVFFIEQVEKMVVKWGAAQLAQLTATQSAEGAKAAAAVAGEEATLPVRVGRFVSDITADAAATFAGVYANLAPIMGPAAAGPAAASSATVLAALGEVPKFELGTDYVPSTGLAIVHKGERITPADQNTGRKGGGGDTHFHIHALDGANVQSWLTRGGAEVLAKAVSKVQNRNPGTRPSY